MLDNAQPEWGDLKYIRVCWVDYVGTTRCRIYPAERLKTRTVKLPWPLLELGAEDMPIEGAIFWDEFIQEIDWTTLTRLPCFQQPTAAVFGYAVCKDPTIEPRAISLCPRTALANAVNCAKEKHDIEMLFGFELEFVLLESVEPIVFAEGGRIGGMSASKLSSHSKLWAFSDDLYDHLRAMGIGVYTFMAESAPAQLEVALDPAPPLQAVDQLVLAKEAVYNLAIKHGLKATFAPKLGKNVAGSGQHIHMSIKRKPDDQPVDLSASMTGAMTRQEQQFLAGLAKALPSLLGYTLPTVASFERHGGPLTGGLWAAYGLDNRECPVRLCYDQPAGYETRRYNFEYRQHDGTDNPYVSVAALIHAGLLGIEEQLELGPPIQCLPFTLSDADKQKLGVTQKQPTTLEHAFDLMVANEKLVDRVGQEVVAAHLRVRRLAAKEYEAMTAEQQRVYMMKYY